MAGEVVAELQNLIDRYWDLAIAEGKEGRDDDTENGDAQECRYEIEKRLKDYAALARERDEAVAEVERVRGCLAQANANHEEFERKWYLACDDRDRLREALEEIADTDPDDGTSSFHDKARAALAGREG